MLNLYTKIIIIPYCTVSYYFMYCFLNSKFYPITGKNNVMVLPKESNNPVAGYLSLHTGSNGSNLHLKWTPNRLMNVDTSIQDKNASWQQAVNIEMNSILFIHCHQVFKSFSCEILLLFNYRIMTSLVH